MAKRLETYRCNICGNIVEVLQGGPGQLVCCGQKMECLEEKTADYSIEKHVPYVEEIDGGYLVKVGENTAHPMNEEHYIQWIELIADEYVYRKYLKPGDKPEAEFKIVKVGEVFAREYCNLHGQWKS